MPKAKNVQEYIAHQRAAIAANPECGTSHYNLAIGLLGQKKYDEAEKELLAAVECSPNLAEAYVQLGGICLQRGDLEGCLAYNKKAVHSRAGFAEGYGNIGFVQLQLGNLMKGMIDESIDTGLKVTELAPEFAVGHNNLGIAYLEKGLHDLAIKHIDKAMELGYEVAPEILNEIKKYR